MLFSIDTITQTNMSSVAKGTDGKIIITLTKGDSYNVPFSSSALGDFTTYTWVGHVRSAGDNVTVFSPTITVLDASHVNAYFSVANTTALTVGNKYEIGIQFTNGSDKTTTIKGYVVVEEGT